MINRPTDPLPFLINSSHQSSPFVIFSSGFFFPNLAVPYGLWELSSLTRDQTQALAMKVLSLTARTNGNAPLFATTDDPTLTLHNHLKATVFTPGGGYSVGLDDHMTAHIHHTIQSIFNTPNLLHSTYSHLSSIPQPLATKNFH